MKQPLPDRLPKLIFDKVLAFILLLLVSPILLLVKVAYLIEGWMIPENKGPMFFSYNAINRGAGDSKIQNPLDQDQIH